jgi:hypothetical protein
MVFTKLYMSVMYATYVNNTCKNHQNHQIIICLLILVHLATRFQRRFLEITCGVVAMFVNASGINEQFYTEPTMDVSYQVLIHLTKRFQRRRFVRNRPFRNKNCLYRPCLLTDQDEMNNLYRGPTTYASYQVLVHLA